jgi:hypothetical protein
MTIWRASHSMWNLTQLIEELGCACRTRGRGAAVGCCAQGVPRRAHTPNNNNNHISLPDRSMPRSARVLRHHLKLLFFGMCEVVHRFLRCPLLTDTLL